ncbi:unnamed protein product [Cylicocyclus nassatus]|uniref:ShKT domain-containing protein n=1 Tax=Cylicocyclus nassatus TaxID=53992 RepID=A0AA36H547_CYLNA|nr:unnamed protein product [Cylicocyclus nassatus]
MKCRTKMFQIFVFTTMCCFVAHGQSTACMNAKGKYTEKAFACEDKLSEESCEALYPLPSSGTEPTVGGNQSRPDACWSKGSDGQTLDNKVVKTAASLCPKRCALCCKSAAFDCEDDNSLDCSKAKQYCKNSVMKAELDLANKCPKTCGLCEEKNAGCTDSMADCDKSLCYYPGFADVMKKQCKKTCGFCDETATTTQKPVTTTQNGTVPTSASTEATTTIPCGADSRCAIWKENGFCGNSFYNYEYKKKFCGQVCNIC